MEKYGDAGKKYIKWCANMAVAQNISEPWIMCQQSDAPEPMVLYFCAQFNLILAFLINYGVTKLKSFYNLIYRSTHAMGFTVINSRQTIPRALRCGLKTGQDGVFNYCLINGQLFRLSSSSPMS